MLEPAATPGVLSSLAALPAADPPVAGVSIWASAGFLALVFTFLTLELGVFYREAPDVRLKAAAARSVACVLTAIAFGVSVHFAYENHWLGLGLNTPMSNAAAAGGPALIFSVFAILGLRSLHFCLAALIVKFKSLKPALILILAFVGVNLLLPSLPPDAGTIAGWVGVATQPMAPVKVETLLPLAIVLGVPALAVVLSILVKNPPKAPALVPPLATSPR